MRMSDSRRAGRSLPFSRSVPAMKPETRTVNNLFEADVHYVVPLYQRPYVWNEDDQWEPLWADVRTLLDHQLGGDFRDGQTWSHFLGAIVLEQEVQAPGRIPRFVVIDGQQRLTTLQLFLAAAHRVAVELGTADDADILADLLENGRRKATEIERFKVWPTNANREAFRAVMTPGSRGEAPDDPANLIQEAFAYFHSTIREWVADPDDESERAERMEMLRVTVCDLVKVVTITLDRDDNAQVIFETLNARGTPLLALDLVKNSLFLEAARTDAEVDELYDRKWRPQLDDDYWRIERRQGRLARPQGELFLMHWLAMKLQTPIPATELFATFRKNLLRPEANPTKLVEELCRDAATYRSFDDQPAGSVERRFFDRLEILETTTFLPVVLRLYRDPRINTETRRRALAIIESWLVRRALMRLTSRNYNRTIPSLLRRLDQSPSEADKVILDDLRSGSGEINRWPADEELTGWLTARDLYGTVAQRRLVMVLAAVEEHMRDAKTEAVSLPSALSIEHLMPQSWQDHWPLDDGLGGEVPEEVRNRYIHRLGNLTLVTSPLNASLSNGPWTRKVQALRTNSVLRLNSEIADLYGDAFGLASIDERSNQLAARICEIWRGPDAW